MEKQTSWDGTTCIKLFEIVGYEPNREFIKQFNVLYPNPHMKKTAITELIKEIMTLHRKPNMANHKTYRSINFKNKNRILFLEKGTIDGIYTHNDYMKRLNNQ